MTRGTIPGALDAEALARLAGHVDDNDYRRRADHHRPDTDGLRDEALRMFHAGLTARDIAVALRVDLPRVQEWIAGATA